MSNFIPYMHLERFGNEEVKGIEIGTSYVFPKLDGTNASVWYEDGQVKCGSRNRELSAEKDNHGFYASMQNDYASSFVKYFKGRYRLYGEWLVPHTLKTYRDDAWRKFYVFDVFDHHAGRLLNWEEIQEFSSAGGLNLIHPIGVVKNGTEEIYRGFLSRNTFLIKDGQGHGEGIVIKNYDYVNRYGRVVWAKIVTNEFKEKHVEAMGAPEVGRESVEERIVAQFLTQAMVDKIVAKLSEGGWNSKMIPRLLQTAYYDLVREELWEALKKFKNPTIDFSALSHYSNLAVKRMRKNLFS